jgi:hypothetical protein
MKIPETYEEFLKLSDKQLTYISKTDMSLADAQKMMDFFNRFDSEYMQKQLLVKRNKINIKSKEE